MSISTLDRSESPRGSRPQVRRNTNWSGPGSGSDLDDGPSNRSSDTRGRNGFRRSPRVRRVVTRTAQNAALALFVSVACLSLLRIFVDTQLQTPILIGLAAGMGVPAMARLLHVPSWFSLIASAIVEGVVLGVWFTSRMSLQFNTEAVGAARREMVSALEQVNRIVAPSPSLIGFGVIVGLVAWLVSLTADLMCFGIPAPIGALVTPTAVAISAAIIAPRKGNTHQAAWVAALVISLSLYLISLGLHERARRSSWFGNEPGSLLASALVLGLAFGGLGFIANRTSERLAIDDRKPSLDWRVSDDESKQRVITSPLVSLQRRILRQSDNEQFSVASRDVTGNDRGSYWRLTALDDFNGESWQSTGEFRKLNTTGTIRTAGQDRSTLLSQNFVIGELGTESIPAAYVPVSYSGTIDGISYAAGTETILANRSLSRGTNYQITSSTPQNLDLRDLERYDAKPSADDPNVLLPVTFPDRVRRLALEITEDQPTTVQKARALQDFFRTQFEYSLDVPAGSSEPALERFLFTDRRGYCEQFSGAFAAMARSIGIPARVAVGFTPGRYDVADRRYHVTGKNSHAWPEIRLGDGTWFPFEPTPGRGFPGLTATTGVDAQDLSEPISTVPTTTIPVTTISPSTTIPQLTPTSPNAKPKTSSPVLFIVLAGLIAAAIAATVIIRRRRAEAPTDSIAPRIRVRERSGPEVRIENAWKLATTKVGVVPERTETEIVAVTPLAGHHPELPELATLVQRARYASDSPAQVSDVEAGRAEELSTVITKRTAATSDSNTPGPNGPGGAAPGPLPPKPPANGSSRNGSPRD